MVFHSQWTRRVADAVIVPTGFSASQIYKPSSAGVTCLIRSALSSIICALKGQWYIDDVI